MRRLLGSVYFQPLYDDDPVPGEQEALAELVAYLAEVAANVRAQSQMLERLDTGGIRDSVARDEFGRKQEALPPRLDMVADRYEKVMLQLQSWSEALSNIQPDLDQACGEARTAHESWLEARQEEQARDDDARAAAEARGAELWEWFEECRARAERAVEAHGEVAEQIEKGIREAIEDGLTNEWWESALDTLGDWMGTVSSFLGIASLAFPVLAPFAVGTNQISLGTRWGIEGEEPNQWTWDVWIGVASLGLGRVIGGPGKQIARSLTRTDRNIRGHRAELNDLRPPSRRRITKRRNESKEQLERRSRRVWTFDPSTSWQTWRANDPEWARCLALVEHRAPVAVTTPSPARSVFAQPRGLG